MIILIGWIVLGLAGTAIYFIPMMVANSRHHRNTAAIVVLNLFLGWTFVGWVVSLAWAFTGEIEDPGPRKRYRTDYM
jgi:hypothetical protein